MSLLQVGQNVALLTTTKDNVRNGEGSFIRLLDNSIIYAFTNYYQEELPYAKADIGFLRSSDEGTTWPERGILYGDGSKNLTNPWLLRMQNDDLGLFYLSYSEDAEYRKGSVYLTRSSDDGKTWSESVQITDPGESFVFVADHGIRLKNGRIILPLTVRAYEEGSPDNTSPYGVATIYYSDDDGLTWQEFDGPRFSGPIRQFAKNGLQDPSPYQCTDSIRLRMLFRTDLGVHYESYSVDNGELWTKPQPNKTFSGCNAPMVWRKTGKYTVAVLNPVPAYVGREYTLPHAEDLRNPLVIYISEDDGRHFKNVKCIDTSAASQNPAFFSGEDYILVGYQIQNDLVIKKVFHSEFHRTLETRTGMTIC